MLKNYAHAFSVVSVHFSHNEAFFGEFAESAGSSIADQAVYLRDSLTECRDYCQELELTATLGYINDLLFKLRWDGQDFDKGDLAMVRSTLQSIVRNLEYELDWKRPFRIDPLSASRI